MLLMRVGDDPDFTKVLDFGVAKLMEGAAQSSRSALALTQAGMVFGTPEFMSPEQACGQPLDGAQRPLLARRDDVRDADRLRACIEAQVAIEWLTHHARTPPPHLVDGTPGARGATASSTRCCSAASRSNATTGRETPTR